MLRRTKGPTYLRFELVRFAREHGIKPAARQFSTTPKTVRKWLRRWEPGSLRGLEDRSRAPLNPPRGITGRQRRQAVALKRRLRSWGASRIKRDFSLSLSEKALRAIWREQGIVKRKRRKHKTKQCLREVKKAWRLFEQTCVDTKDLCDIPELWAQARALGLPRYQYTAREVTSGWHYVSFAQECTLAYSKLFAEVILSHPKACGVKFKDSRLQTDNGCEFVGSWQSRQDSKFTVAVEVVKGLRHTRCPPRAHTWQSDVETVHRIIEDEFYEVERFTSRSDFLQKAGAYNLWFNVARRNRGKEHKTPWELIHEREPKIDPAICALPPIFLDELFMKKLDSKLQWGYDVIPHTSPRMGIPTRPLSLQRQCMARRPMQLRRAATRQAIRGTGHVRRRRILRTPCVGASRGRGSYRIASGSAFQARRGPHVASPLLRHRAPVRHRCERSCEGAPGV
jgi:transposase